MPPWVIPKGSIAKLQEDVSLKIVDYRYLIAKVATSCGRASTETKKMVNLSWKEAATTDNKTTKFHLENYSPN